MDNINQITSIVLVNKIYENEDSDFARSIISGYLFTGNSLNQNPIKIIFSENNEARRIRGLKEGDIIFVYGTLGYTIEDCIIIYASSFIPISKNVKGLSVDERKIISFSYAGLPNKILLSGVVTNNIENRKKALIDIHRGKLIRGEIKERDVLPCIYINEPELKIGSLVFIDGFIKDDKLYGVIETIH